MGMSIDEMDTIVCAMIAIGIIIAFAIWDIFRKR